MSTTVKLHPSQFEVNDAWIFFRLNSVPIHTVKEGSFNIFALMDAASCFILGSSPSPANFTEPPELISKQLLKEGRAHKDRLPKILYIPIGEKATSFENEARRQGISILRVPEVDLRVFIGEAKDNFNSQFGTGGLG